MMFISFSKFYQNNYAIHFKGTINKGVYIRKTEKNRSLFYILNITVRTRD